MGVLGALAIAALIWAVWKRKITPAQLPPIALGLAGAFLAARGNVLFGLGALGIALFWYRGLHLRLFGKKTIQGGQPAPSDQYAIDNARFMLGVSRFDNAQYIRERHEALIAKMKENGTHDDQRERELNEARDLLLRDADTKMR